MRANSLLPVIQYRLAAEEIKRQEDKAKQSAGIFQHSKFCFACCHSTAIPIVGDSIPLWLTKASDELAE